MTSWTLQERIKCTFSAVRYRISSEPGATTIISGYNTFAESAGTKDDVVTYYNILLALDKNLISTGDQIAAQALIEVLDSSISINEHRIRSYNNSLIDLNTGVGGPDPTNINSGFFRLNAGIAERDNLVSVINSIYTQKTPLLTGFCNAGNHAHGRDVRDFLDSLFFISNTFGYTGTGRLECLERVIRISKGSATTKTLNYPDKSACISDVASKSTTAGGQTDNFLAVPEVLDAIAGEICAQYDL